MEQLMARCKSILSRIYYYLKYLYRIAINYRNFFIYDIIYLDGRGFFIVHRDGSNLKEFKQYLR